MKVLVVGGGGREHCLAWKLAQSERVSQLYCAPGNAGTAQLGQNLPFEATQLDELLSFARSEGIDLTVVGPERPLADGIVDRFSAAGLRIFGPTAAAARIEADKAYAKQLMRQQAIPTAEARIFHQYRDARAYVASRDQAVVVKAAGLAEGKGAFVCDEPAEGLLVLERLMKHRIFGPAGEVVVVEEKLVGQEVSILAFVDGRTIYVMESSQDHKPIGEQDTGPNTGGMGAYSPTPMVSEALMGQIEREILVPIVDALNRDASTYRGVLYAGLMLTAAGPKVLEFNCRFGDPETQPILMRLHSDLLEPIEAVIDGQLDRVTLQWDARPAVCVVMASGGYPGPYEKGKVIAGLDRVAAMPDVMVFHAGTAVREGRVVTSGGRVLGVTALGSDIAQARQRAYEAVEMIHFDKAYWRRD
ncbi:MAG: phosphoribosylamine--glycine ligase, partial [Phycisphaerae bacterium]